MEPDQVVPMVEGVFVGLQYVVTKTLKQFSISVTEHIVPQLTCINSSIAVVVVWLAVIFCRKLRIKNETVTLSMILS